MGSGTAALATATQNEAFISKSFVEVVGEKIKASITVFK